MNGLLFAVLAPFVAWLWLWEFRRRIGGNVDMAKLMAEWRGK